MKLIKQMLSFIFLVVSVAGCTTNDNGSGDEGDTAPEITQFNPGVYTGEASGFGGTLIVEVEVDETSILSIDIIENHETLGIGTAATDIMPSEMIEHQTTSVDVVSGATLSSFALRNAVTDALSDSGVDTALISQPIEKDTEDSEHFELSTDILIVGGGGSGMSAAISADEQGADVILVEKMSFLGGAAAISGGQVNAGNSDYQRELGVTDDTPEVIAADLLKGGNNLNDEVLVELYSENSGRTFDWLHEYVGVDFDDELIEAAEHSNNRGVYGEGYAPGINANIKEKLSNTNVDLKLNTEVTDLIINDEGIITGANAIDNDGNTYEITAEAVVLCTGGFGYNKDLLPESLQSVLYYGPVSSTGDGLLMAQELDAKTQLLEHGKIYPNGIEIASGIGRSTISANSAAYQQGSAILVDRLGNRVANELGTLSDVRQAMLQQEDQTLFIVMDEKTFSIFREQLVVHKYANNQEIDQWLENNGSSLPVFANDETIEGAADSAGIEGNTLAETIENFNIMMSNGEDTDFDRPVTEPIDVDGNIYIVEQKPRFATTLGGVVVNERMQVLTQDDTVIQGLYAAGELVGGLHGDDSMPSVAVSWAYTSGKLVGEFASKDIVE